MAIRADQALMIGVVGLGAYAVYRMTRPREDVAPEDVPILNGQGVPTAPVFPQNIAQGPTLQLPAGTQPDGVTTTNRWYRGRLELPQQGSATRESANLTHLSRQSPRQAIEAALRGFSFDRVEVYMTPEEAAPRITLAAAMASPTPGSRWFFGRYAGPRGTRARPPVLTVLYPTAVPTTAEMPATLTMGPQIGARLRLHPSYAAAASPPVLVDPSATAVIMIVEETTPEVIVGRLVAIENTTERERFEAPLQTWPPRRVILRRDALSPVISGYPRVYRGFV